MKLLAVLLLLVGCIVGDEREGLDEQSAENWGIYDPQPGHPTIDERDRFVTEIAPYAQEAEATYGVPAAAITAMACNESGFGWTRIALEAIPGREADEALLIQPSGSPSPIPAAHGMA